MDVQPERAVEQGLRDERAVRGDDDRLGVVDRGDSSSCSGWRTSMPSRSAASFAGGAPTCRPRPRGRSGRVSRNAISCVSLQPLEHVGAERRGAATTRNVQSAAACRKHGKRLAAALGRRPVEDEHAVEMIDLVLGDPRREPLELELDRSPVGIARLDPQADARRSTGTTTPCERQAALRRPRPSRPSGRGSPG